jgi:hypothetical protein
MRIDPSLAKSDAAPHVRVGSVTEKGRQKKSFLPSTAKPPYIKVQRKKKYRQSEMFVQRFYGNPVTTQQRLVAIAAGLAQCRSAHAPLA